jgi:hypothetical protein
MVRAALVASVACTRAAGQLPDQVAVDGAEQQLAGLGARARAVDVSRIQASLVAEK